MHTNKLLCVFGMTYTFSDYNILSYLLKKNRITYSQAIEWAYSKYTDDGIDPFIEKIGLAIDKEDILELIGNEYQVYGDPQPEFLIGEIAKQYSMSELTLEQAVRRILYRLDVDLPKDEEQKFYIADDYYDWHDSPDIEAEKHVVPIMQKHQSTYEKEVAKFTT